MCCPFWIGTNSVIPLNTRLYCQFTIELLLLFCCISCVWFASLRALIPYITYICSWYINFVVCVSVSHYTYANAKSKRKPNQQKMNNNHNQNIYMFCVITRYLTTYTQIQYIRSEWAVLSLNINALMSNTPAAIANNKFVIRYMNGKNFFAFNFRAFCFLSSSYISYTGSNMTHSTCNAVKLCENSSRFRIYVK